MRQTPATEKTYETGLSLRGALSDEAISGFGQGLLRYARNDTWTLGHTVEVLSHSPKGCKLKGKPTGDTCLRPYFSEESRDKGHAFLKVNFNSSSGNKIRTEAVVVQRNKAVEEKYD